MKKYKCKENDNYIEIETFDDSIVEICIGDDSAPSYGETVIGYNDLKNSLSKVGYIVEKDNSAIQLGKAMIWAKKKYAPSVIISYWDLHDDWFIAHGEDGPNPIPLLEAYENREL